MSFPQRKEFPSERRLTIRFSPIEWKQLERAARADGFELTERVFGSSFSDWVRGKLGLEARAKREERATAPKKGRR